MEKFNVMKRIFAAIICIPAILFIVTGLRWLVAPEPIAAEFGFALAEGLGLSSQVGDMSGFFLFLGASILMGLVSQQRAWFYAGALLLSFTAVGRTLAWLIHDAALASQIIPEVVLAVMLLIASSVLVEDD
jgi:hypothetical protein